VYVCVRVYVFTCVRVHATCNIHIKFLQDSIEFYNSKGLGDLPQILMNGVKVDMEEV